MHSYCFHICFCVHCLSLMTCWPETLPPACSAFSTETMCYFTNSSTPTVRDLKAGSHLLTPTELWIMKLFVYICSTITSRGSHRCQGWCIWSYFSLGFFDWVVLSKKYISQNGVSLTNSSILSLVNNLQSYYLLSPAVCLCTLKMKGESAAKLHKSPPC